MNQSDLHGRGDPAAVRVATAAVTTLPDMRRQSPVALIRRPILLIPALLAGTFILVMVESTGVSPWAALRLLALVPLASLAVTVFLAVALRSPDAAAILITLLLLAAASMENTPVFVLASAALVLVLAIAILARRRVVVVRWPRFTWVLSSVTVILLLAIGIRSVQEGRLTEALDDLRREGPLRAPASVWASTGAQHPDVYLFLLDGYPRSDKLLGEFGIDNTSFLESLEFAGFSVASRSRANYLQTHLTMLSMLNGRHLEDLQGAQVRGSTIRRGINSAVALRPFTDEGYETIAISSGFELVSLRSVDRFIDTGQINEFERVLIEQTVEPALRLFDPGFLPRQAGERTLQSLHRAQALAAEPGPARLVLVHIASPHSPLQFSEGGTLIEETGAYTVFDDRYQLLHLGEAEYGRRLGQQIAFLDRRMLEVVDAIDRSGRPSVVAIFSDHGSGARFDASDQRPVASDLDLRSANLLAVRGIGQLEDGMTLVNLLPLIAHKVLGIPFDAQPDSVRIMNAEWSMPSLVIQSATEDGTPSVQLP